MIDFINFQFHTEDRFIEQPIPLDRRVKKENDLKTKLKSADPEEDRKRTLVPNKGIRKFN